MLRSEQTSVTRNLNGKLMPLRFNDSFWWQTENGKYFCYAKNSRRLKVILDRGMISHENFVLLTLTGTADGATQITSVILNQTFVNSKMKSSSDVIYSEKGESIHLWHDCLSLPPARKLCKDDEWRVLDVCPPTYVKDEVKNTNVEMT